MKTRIFPAMTLLFMLMSVTGQAQVDLSIGATGGYVWWKPSWSDSKCLERLAYVHPALNPPVRSVLMEDAADFGTSSNFMGGPMVSLVLFKKWSVSSVFNIGRYSFRKAGFSRLQNLLFVSATMQYSNGLPPLVIERDCLKWDSDSAVGYSFNRYLKLFAGFKVQGYEYDQKYSMYDQQLFVRDFNDRFTSYGPGLGVGLTVPLVERLYLAANFSGLVLWGVERIDVNRSYFIQPALGIVYAPMYTPGCRILSYGFNATTNLGYFVDAINTTIMVGGRYQLLFNRQKFTNAFVNDVSFNIYDRKYDHFFGVTMSVIYTFTIGGGKNEKS